MASTTTSLINYNFGGIRRKDAMFSQDKITCSDCQNVELYFTKLNSGVGIRTTSGNYAINSLIPTGEEVIRIFESNQLGSPCFLIYAESSTQGKIYYLNIQTNSLQTIVSGLSVTGCACACDYTQGILDMFVFSNGVEVKYIYSNTETAAFLQVETAEHINLIDSEGRTVRGLGVVNYNSRIWIFNENVLWYSVQGDCRDFNTTNPNLSTSAGFIEPTKPITAIHPYLGSLAVFHKDSSVLITEDATTGFAQSEESPGGCASYDALAFHGTDLYFYDDTKKGVFSFQQIVNGDKTLGDNIALDIQDELLKIHHTDTYKIRTLSVVTEDRNEVWFLIPISDNANYSFVMIFDYIRGEWIKRKCQHINAMGMVDGTLYSGGKQIYKEYQGSNFNGEFIESYYTCTIFNLGEDNTLKITKFPPRLSVDGSYANHFFVKYVKNYDKQKEPKLKEIKAKSLKNVLIYNTGMNYNEGWVYKVKNVTTTVKIPSATFKALEITFYTDRINQDFCIKTMEFSRIKVKQV